MYVSCSDCEFWQDWLWDGSDFVCECRRRAPDREGWPTVSQERGCGEGLELAEPDAEARSKAMDEKWNEWLDRERARQARHKERSTGGWEPRKDPA